MATRLLFMVTGLVVMTTGDGTAGENDGGRTHAVQTSYGCHGSFHAFYLHVQQHSVEHDGGMWWLWGGVVLYGVAWCSGVYYGVV